MGKNNLNKKLYEMGSSYRILDNSTYGSGLSTYGLGGNRDEILDRLDLANYKSIYEISRDKATAEREARIAKFAIHGRGMSNSALSKYLPTCDSTERPVKLSDICFSEPFAGLIESRPGVYGVISVHHIAGYKIVIKRFSDTSDDVVWYETPMRTYHCTFDQLEEIIHNDLLIALQRDLEWKNLK